MSTRMISMRAVTTRLTRASIRDALAYRGIFDIRIARLSLCLLTHASGLRTAAELAELTGVTEADIRAVLGPLTEEEQALGTSGEKTAQPEEEGTCQ